MTSRLLRLKAVALIDRSVEALSASPVSDPRQRSSGSIDRRKFFAATATSMAAAFLAGCDARGPQSADKLLAYATRKNEAIEGWLLRHTRIDQGSPGAVVAGGQFPSYFVSSTVPVYNPLTSGPWALQVSGMVRTPLTLSLEQLMAMPRIEQRVNHFCVEGWNAVARFVGASMRDVITAAGPLPGANVVDFQSFDDGYHESWDLESVMHPQTIVVYAKDGIPLSPAYGAPARVHSPIKLGYKNTKYLTKIVVMAERNGGYWSDRGYEWFGGT